MPRIIKVEQRLRQGDEALAGLLQLEQADRIDRIQRDVLGDLVLAPVLVQVGYVHALEIVMQTLAAQQPLLQAVPVAELDEVRVA